MILLFTSNAKRIEETKYGERMNLMEITSEKLDEKLNRLLNDKELRSKWEKAKNRIQKEKRILKVSEKIVHYIERL